MHFNDNNQYNPFKKPSKEKSKPIDITEKSLEQISTCSPLSQFKSISKQYNDSGQNIILMNTDKGGIILM